MYNRYTQQRDGSYQRSRVPDQNQPGPSPRPAPPPRQEPEPGPARDHPEPPCETSCQEEACEKPSAAGFLSGLLPSNWDTGDLLMLLILLLLLYDGNEEASPALLTIALFFLLR